MCGFALAGMVTVAVPGLVGTDSSRVHLAPGRSASPEQCLAGARVVDPEANPQFSEGGHLTPQQAALYDQQLQEALVPLRGQKLEPPHTVPVVVHVISAEDGRGEVSDERVQKQIDVLNAAYSGEYAGGADEPADAAAPEDAARAAGVAEAPEAADTGFRFELSEVTRTANDEWFTRFSTHRDTIRSELRQGDAETLNIYTSDLGTGLLGYSTFPQDYESAPEQDGVVLAHDTLPGGDRERFNLGHTGTHEVGHWLGLFHTFQNGCSSPGDYVEDTPSEREAASGCPEGRDTCPEDPGEDPVTNFMNYSDDTCMTHFTEGQATRMVEHWEAFRAA
ncbi:zinc metalloprotease [Nocardiopsis halotolerans]|uniref:zinc metalloprotease n=1 Tax=Nocardiopsis halotolerans TaxID=124252 RepID=UPI00034D8A08|nr:zinc metalloprotease [Nocardiopsis halotolerans]